MSSSVSFEIHGTHIKCNQLPPKWFGRSGSFYVKFILDGQEIYRTARVKGRTSISWIDTCVLQAPEVSSSLEIRVYTHRTVWKDKRIGRLKYSVDNVLKESSSASFDRALQNSDALEMTTKVTFSIAQTPSTNNIDQREMGEAPSQVRPGVGNVKSLPQTTDKIGSVADALPMVAVAVKSFADTWSTLLDKIETFTRMTDQFAEIHPYAQTACFILSGVPKAIVAQRDRDAPLGTLMETIEDIYSFVVEAELLKIIESHQKTLEDMGRLTIECAYLIRDYTVDKNFWKRIATLTLAGVEAKMEQYDTTFKELKAAFQGRAIARIEIAVFRSLVYVEDIGIEYFIANIMPQSSRKTDIFAAKDVVLYDMPYASGAGYDSDKCCLPSTRASALKELHEWINMPDGDDAPKVWVMTGVAGCGKSAIAHTVARHYDAMERLGSAVFFERADQAQRNTGNLLSTVARDIANLDADWRTALYNIVQNNDSLRHTKSISRQMKSFILEPAKALKTIGPIVIVIDALDESGDAPARSDLLQSLVTNASALPSNFRILITACAERDIQEVIFNTRHVTVIQLEGLVMKESAAILKARAAKCPPARCLTYHIRLEGAECRMEARCADGISAGAEFVVYADENTVLPLCTVTPDSTDITPVDKNQVKFEVVMDEDLLSVRVLDKRITELYGGTMRIPFPVFPVKPEPGAIRPVLRAISHYYWHLDQISDEDSDFQSSIGVEFFKLETPQTELNDAGSFVLEPGPHQLCKDNIIDFTVDPNAVYGMKITNSTPKDLYPGIFYFEAGDLSIVPYYLMSNSSKSPVDSPLKKNGGTLTIGYGCTGTSPRAYAVRDGQDVDVGFLKMFFATRYVDLSDIPQNTPFLDGRADVTSKKKNTEKWGTILIPLVQRRKQ